jgi:hypothetical protein
VARQLKRRFRLSWGHLVYIFHIDKILRPSRDWDVTWADDW